MKGGACFGCDVEDCGGAVGALRLPCVPRSAQARSSRPRRLASGSTVDTFYTRLGGPRSLVGFSALFELSGTDHVDLLNCGHRPVDTVLNRCFGFFFNFLVSLFSGTIGMAIVFSSYRPERTGKLVKEASDDIARQQRWRRTASIRSLALSKVACFSLPLPSEEGGAECCCNTRTLACLPIFDDWSMFSSHWTENNGIIAEHHEWTMWCFR